MDQIILSMLEKYDPITSEDYKNALKEVIQEVALFGLWRAKFFEHAAFYGGTALRILYRLDRFSEDLDFSLLKTKKDFSLSAYHAAVERELAAFGFDVSIQEKKKSKDSYVQSAFLKANTLQHLVKVGVPEEIADRCHFNEAVRVKFEVDTDPPGGFNTRAEYLLEPVPFWVKTYTKPDLFAGKLHALLCRSWGSRVKGRDWYDFLWYVRNKIPVNLSHLDLRMQQSGHRKGAEPLEQDELQRLLLNKIEALDIEKAKLDMLPFIQDARFLEGWSKELFRAAAARVLIGN